MIQKNVPVLWNDRLSSDCFRVGLECREAFSDARPGQFVSLFLSERYDPLLRRPAQNAINLLINSQHENGGWRYSPTKTAQGDMSISGWQIMALKSAQMAGLDVPSIAVTRCKSFLESCCDNRNWQEDKKQCTRLFKMD